MLLAVFLGTHFSHNLQFRGLFGIELAMLFGVPGTLGNRFKTLKGIRFSHFGDAFCRYGFQARSGGCFFVDFHDFLLPFGTFWQLLDASGNLLDPGATPGPFRARGAKSKEKIAIWLNFGGSRGRHFETILVKLMSC